MHSKQWLNSKQGPSFSGVLVAAVLVLWIAWTASGSAAEDKPASGLMTPTVQLVGVETTVWLGRTQVIPFHLESAAKWDMTIDASAGDSDVLEIVRPAAVLEGMSIGYIRVRGIRPGESKLTIGGQTMNVVVRAAPASASSDGGVKLEIVGPVNGAAVWGRVMVGVELWHGGDESLKPDKVRLSIPGPEGKTLEPISTTPAGGAPWSVARFDLDADAIPEGSAALVARIEKGATKDVIRSHPVTVEVIRPHTEGLVQGECEATLDTPRVGRRGSENRPRVGRSPQASGGRFVACYSADPAWLFPLEAKEAGLYQVMVTASGDPAAGALPSMGVVVGEGDRAVTASRLVDHRWHRIPVGRPFSLKAGQHVLSVRFLNDFHAPDYADRNLYLDKYEVVRVGGAAEPEGDYSGAMMMAAPAMRSGGKAASAGSTGGGGMMKGAATGDGGDVRVAFLRPMHNLPLRGDLIIDGTTWWRDPDNTLTPLVSLLINGKPVMSQRAPDPRFRVSPGYFQAGENIVQMIARLEDGTVGATPAQVVRVEPSTVEEAAARRYWRFGVEDAAWGGSFEGKLSDNQRPDGHRVAYFHGNAQATLDLPDDMEGRFELYLDQRGDDFEGPAVATLYLQAGEGERTRVVAYNTRRWWDDARFGEVDLPRGHKKLIVAFENDHYLEKKGDRNLYIKALSLRDLAPQGDAVPPSVRLLYPLANGHEVRGVDAIVAEAADNDSLDWVDLVIDGKRLGMQPDRDPAIGRLVFPLVTRSLPEGEHTIKVRARDRVGNQSDSQEVTIRVRGESPATPSDSASLGRYERAIRLLDRFAFGPDPQELADVLVMGERAYLESRLGATADEPGERAALGRGAATWPIVGGEYEVGVRVLQHLQITPNPVRARFVMWAQNHFSTWVRKTEGWRKWDEQEAFTRLGVAPFGELLYASATSPAMLVYLDQQRSFAGRLNENYAREIMELHTLGVHGGYTQGDVTALAGVLNGWTVCEEAASDGRGYPLASVFRYDPTLNDGQVRRVIGVALDGSDPTQRQDQVRLMLEVLASHPSTAKHVARSLVEHYVAYPAPEKLTDDIAAVFVRTGGDTRAMLLAIAEHPLFWSPDHAQRLARPIDYALRLARTTRSDDVWEVYDFLRRSGMGIFDCSTPNGYPEEDARYADSNAMLQRWRLAKAQEWRLSTLVPGPWRWREGADRARWMQDCVDVIATRLTGRPLAATSNEAALRVLDTSSGDMDRRMRDLAAFIGALPEASLR